MVYQFLRWKNWNREFDLSLGNVKEKRGISERVHTPLKKRVKLWIRAKRYHIEHMHIASRDKVDFDRNSVKHPVDSLFISGRFVGLWMASS